MRPQPLGEGVGLAAGQHVHRPVRLHVDQNGGVAVAAAAGELVDAQHPRCDHRRVGNLADDPQHGHPAHRYRELVGQPCAGPPAQRHRHRGHHLSGRAGPPAVPTGQARHLLGERLPHATVAVTEEPADRQHKRDLAATDTGVGQAPNITAVHPSRLGATPRARGADTGRRRFDAYTTALEKQPVQAHRGEVRQQC
jgi:hypothetical protein